jgi:hypothetical protein
MGRPLKFPEIEKMRIGECIVVPAADFGGNLKAFRSTVSQYNKRHGVHIAVHHCDGDMVEIVREHRRGNLKEELQYEVFRAIARYDMTQKDVRELVERLSQEQMLQKIDLETLADIREHGEAVVLTTPHFP